ncbi:MAG: hypothetical protein HC875_12470 [Anaerolineales bacterium]|nr:hypothetical protein [Anaerolineales bacterium]
MNQELFQTILNTLASKTLAYLLRDLEESQAEWRDFPGDAPPLELQQAFLETVTAIRTAGAAQAQAEGLDFAQLVEQARAELAAEEDWMAQRNQQIRQNWLSDLE